MVHLFVDITVVSKWPSSDELAARNGVIAELDAVDIGSCTGARGGLGKMDFSYSVKDESTARAAIESAMRMHMPNVEYHVRVSV
jgi:hypothetical protein